MTVRIDLPPLLSERTGGRATVEIRAGTVTAALEALARRYPEAAPLLWRAPGEANPYLVIFLNDRDIRAGNGMESELRDGDRLVIVSALEGG